MIIPASVEVIPVNTTTRSYFPAPNRSSAVALVINAALSGPTRTLPTPYMHTKMEYVTNTVLGSLLTARPMATRRVPKPKPKKP